MADIRYLDTGIYTIARASELTGISSRKIHDWLFGTTRTNHVGRWEPILPRERDRPILLGFVDLMEVVLVDAFRKGGMSWNKIAKAINCGHAQYGAKYPFVTQKFFLALKKIYMDMPCEGRCETALETDSGQFVLTSIIDPLQKHREAMRLALQVYEVLDYAEDGFPFRWHPIGRSRAVVLDRRVSMGEPITAVSGVPTRVIVEALKEYEFDRASVRDGYGVSEVEIEGAIEYEATRERVA